MKHATVKQTRRLRDGRQLAEIPCCPYCQGDHWLIADGSTLAYVPCASNRPVLLDGLGAPVR
ncbi:MAG: hypothetical protein ACRDTV_12480 [Mycobacterium sp.]